MKIKLLSTSHHRNGICGDPFNVHLFRDEDGTTKLAVDFGNNAFAVLDVKKLAAGDIAFGSNSWRGDHYQDVIRWISNGAKPAVADGAFFVNYGIPRATAAKTD